MSHPTRWGWSWQLWAPGKGERTQSWILISGSGPGGGWTWTPSLTSETYFQGGWRRFLVWLFFYRTAWYNLSRIQLCAPFISVKQCIAIVEQHTGSIFLSLDRKLCPAVPGDKDVFLGKQVIFMSCFQGEHFPLRSFQRWSVTYMKHFYQHCPHWRCGHIGRCWSILGEYFCLFQQNKYKTKLNIVST